MKNKWIFLLLILGAIALVLRFYNLGMTDLAPDEAKTALGIAFPHSFLLPQLTILSQKIFGVSAWAVRLPYTLLGIFSIGLAYLFGGQIKDSKFGLVLALVMAFLPGNIILSRTAYLDISLIFAWLLVLYFWARYEKSEAQLDLILLFLALLVAPWFKMQAIFLHGAFIIYLVIKYRWRFIFSPIFWLIVISFLPYFFYTFSQPQQLFDVRHYVMDEVGQSGPGGWWEFLLLLWNNFKFWWVLLVLGTVDFCRKKRISNWSSVEIILASLSAIVFLILIFTPKRFYYYVMLDIPAAYLLANVCHNAISGYHKYFFKFATILVAGLAVITAGFYALNQSGCRGDNCFWRNNSQQINKVLQPFDLVYLDTDLGFPARWYIDKITSKLDNYRPLGSNTQGAVVLAGDRETVNFVNSYSQIYNFSQVIIITF